MKLGHNEYKFLYQTFFEITKNYYYYYYYYRLCSAYIALK